LTEIVGQGGIHVSEQVFFKAPVKLGDTITVLSEITEKIEEKRRIIITSTWTNQDGIIVMTGKAECLLPR
jgi:3-hydroxybutyryl-CoA dehydratase